MATKESASTLDAMDWRFHAVDVKGSSLLMVATSEQRSNLSKKVVSFALPSAPALYLGLANDARGRRLAISIDESFVSHPSPQGVWPEEHTMVFTFFQEFCSEVIFAFTAIEAFANEVVPADFVYAWTNGKKELVSLTAPEIEQRVSLDEKLKRVLPLAHNLRSPAGTHAWERFRKLKRVRDRLIHLKSIDRRNSGPEQQTIWGLMLAERATNFVQAAYLMIGAFPSLIANRRWYSKAGEVLDV